MDSYLVRLFMDITKTTNEVAFVYMRNNNFNLPAAHDNWLKDIEECGSQNYLEMEALNMSYNSEKDMCRNVFETNNQSSIRLPTFHVNAFDYTEYIHRLIKDTKTESSLETTNVINWWDKILGSTSKMHCLLTTGDGNCLLHAVSLFLNGYQDALLGLRSCLNEFIFNSPIMKSIKRRWKYEVALQNFRVPLYYSQEEWDKEWEIVVRMARAMKNPATGAYSGLEEIHIFILANMLKRPIVVFSSDCYTNLDKSIIAPVTFGGIYLPLAVEDPDACSRVPITLTYDSTHFSALVFEKFANESLKINYLPLVNLSGCLFPLKFSVDPGKDYNFDCFALDQVPDLIQELNSDEQMMLTSYYLNTCVFPNKINNANKALSGDANKSPVSQKYEPCSDNPLANDSIFCAIVEPKTVLPDETMLKNLVEESETRFILNIAKEVPAEISDELIANAIDEGLVVCETVGCKNSATCMTDYVCLSCYHTVNERIISNLEYGIGKSKFYASPAGENSNIKKVEEPIVSSADVRNNNDNSIYLSNSTFYNDSKQPFESHFNKFDA